MQNTSTSALLPLEKIAANGTFPPFASGEIAKTRSARFFHPALVVCQSSASPNRMFMLVKASSAGRCRRTWINTRAVKIERKQLDRSAHRAEKPPSMLQQSALAASSRCQQVFGRVLAIACGT